MRKSEKECKGWRFTLPGKLSKSNCSSQSMYEGQCFSTTTCFDSNAHAVRRACLADRIATAEMTRHIFSTAYMPCSGMQTQKALAVVRMQQRRRFEPTQIRRCLLTPQRYPEGPVGAWFDAIPHLRSIWQHQPANRLSVIIDCMKPTGNHTYRC